MKRSKPSGLIGRFSLVLLFYSYSYLIIFYSYFSCSSVYFKKIFLFFLMVFPYRNGQTIDSKMVRKALKKLKKSEKNEKNNEKITDGGHDLLKSPRAMFFAPKPGYFKIFYLDHCYLD